MPPSNRRIVTLQDLDGGSSRADSGGGGGGGFGAVEQWMEPHIPQASKAFPVAPPHSSTMRTPYCQPVKTTGRAATTTTSSSSSSRIIPLYPISSLPMADTCRQILERLWTEFGPIIQRRGYRVTSISEFCCCGDGVDEAPGKCQTTTTTTTTRRKRPKQGDSVWGYNQTTFFGRRRRGGAGPTNHTTTASSSSSLTGSTEHTIHLRLRQPQHHTTQLLSWEFVAGTMAHELSHCIHQNHGSEFYKLMEEILDEHATLQLEQMGDLVYGTSAVAAAATAATGGGTHPSWAPTLSIPPTSVGRRLGGDPSTKKSRLRPNPGAGKVVVRDSGATAHQPAGPPLTPQARREAMAQAAERRRQRQMQQVRRIIESSKEPCVIEILDDEDHGDDNSGVGDPEYLENKKKKKRSTTPGWVDLTGVTTTPRMPTTVTSMAGTIDLTASLDDRIINDVHAAAARTSSVADSCDKREWACHRCTVLNRPLALLCDVCLEERDRTAASKCTNQKTTKVEGTVIELD
jgi:DNA-dependent metalloprotease WSS1